MSIRSIARVSNAQRMTAMGAALLAVTALAACGSSSPKTAANAASPATATAGASTSAPPVTQTVKLKLGYANPLGGTDPQSAAIQGGAACYAAKVGGSFSATAAGDDLNKQISDIDSLIAQGINGLVLIPLDPGGLSGAYQRATAAHVRFAVRPTA